MTNELNRNPFDTDIQSFSKDKFVVYLNNLLTIENLSENRLQSRIESTLIEEVRQILECHLEKTKEQQLRLRQFITKFGGMPTVDKAQSTHVIAPFSIQKELQRIMTVAETELQEIQSDIRLENEEMISYNSLLQMAIKMSVDVNISEVIPILKQSLEEEEKMYGWLAAHLPRIFAKLWPEIISPSSMTTEQVEIIDSIKQTITCQICDDALFNSTKDLKLHVISNHSQNAADIK